LKKIQDFIVQDVKECTSTIKRNLHASYQTALKFMDDKLMYPYSKRIS